MTASVHHRDESAPENGHPPAPFPAAVRGYADKTPAVGQQSGSAAVPRPRPPHYPIPAAAPATRASSSQVTPSSPATKPKIKPATRTDKEQPGQKQTENT